MIIAGFGRFGQIVARLLFANGMRAIVLDHDAEQVDLLRKFGYKVFYGDATRLDLLRAAGAGEACLLVNAIDDIADSLALTDRVREHFPDLPMIARARNVTHYVELRTRGVTVVERETFESALRTGRHVLEALGVDRFRAREMADAFRRHNIATMIALVPHFQRRSKSALRGEGRTRRAPRVLRPRPRPVRDGAAQRLESRILNTRSDEWQRTRRTSSGRVAIRIFCRTGTAGDM